MTDAGGVEGWTGAAAFGRSQEPLVDLAVVEGAGGDQAGVLSRRAAEDLARTRITEAAGYRRSG